MKKLIMLLLVAGTCTTAAVAQDSTTKDVTTNKMEKKAMKDCVWMKNGKLIEVTQAGKKDLTQDLTLSNGTIVQVDGSVKAPDGTAWKLKEGEAIDMTGKLIPEKDMNKKEAAQMNK